MGLTRSASPGAPASPGRAAAVAVFGRTALTVGLRSASPPAASHWHHPDHVDLGGEILAGNDGSRVYFNESPRVGTNVLAQVAARGGDVARIAAPFRPPRSVDVSPDGAELLVVGSREQTAGLGAGGVDPCPSWVAARIGSAISGPSTRPGHLTDGTSSTRRVDGEVHVASSDGSGSRRIWTAPGHGPLAGVVARWRRLRLTVFAQERTAPLGDRGGRPGSSSSLAGLQSARAAVDGLPREVLRLHRMGGTHQGHLGPA